MDDRLRGFLAELIGTFVLVLFGAGAICASYLPSDDYRPEVSAVALAEGFTLAVLLTAILPLSQGWLNPALTLMLWVFKRLDGRRTVLLIASQLLGAILAGLVLRLLFADDVLREARLGTPHLKALLTASREVTLRGLLTGVAVEMVLTAVLAWSIFAALYDPRTPRLGGLLPGLAQTAIIVVGYHLTGGCANPARWLGPLVWQFTLPNWQELLPLADHLVYWVGPIVGALLGAYTYTVLLLRQSSPLPAG